MTLPHNNSDNRGQKHWFTLSSSPTENLLAITTKQAPDRSSTFKQVLFSLQAGASINISEPMGDFVLPKDSNIPLVFVAGGIGITPVRSMIKWLSDTKEHRQIRIIYGARSADDLAFLELFENYGAKTDIILTGGAGQLTAENVMKLGHVTDNTLVYVSGPEPMVESLETDLKAANVSSEKLVLDFFPGYPIT